MVLSRIASNARLDRLAAVAREQVREPGRAHQAGGALGVEVGGQRLRHPAVAGHDLQRRLVGDARVPEADRGHHQPLLVDARRAGRHRAGAGAADVVVVAEGLHERDDLALVEHRHRDAEVGQVADAALGLVDVVVEEHVALAHGLQRVVPGDRVHERAVGAAGQLAQLPVVDAGAEVVRVADHRRAGGARDRGLDLHLDAGEGALDDLEDDRVDAQGRHGAVHSGHFALSLVITRLPYASTRTVKPGWTGTVEPNSSTMTGPATSSPARRSGRQ